MKTRISFFLVFGLLVISLTGCASKAVPTPSFEAMPTGAPLLPSAPRAAPAAGAVSQPAAEDAASMGLQKGGGASTVERLVIQNADLSIVVDDPVTVMDEVSKMAGGMKGFVVTSNVHKIKTENGQEVPEANITIRVPAERLDEALEQIKGYVKNKDIDILSENRSGQDVTKEYTDLKSRLYNLEQTEIQLREIQASATNTEDVMSVFNQLTQVREQIEVIKGQIKFYEESAALSAIKLRLVAQASIASLTIGGWQPAGVARDAIQTLIDALKFLANLAIWLVLFVLPVAIIIYIPVRLVIAGVRRMQSRRKTGKPSSPEPPAKS